MRGFILLITEKAELAWLTLIACLLRDRDWHAVIRIMQRLTRDI